MRKGFQHKLAGTHKSLDLNLPHSDRKAAASLRWTWRTLSCFESFIQSCILSFISKYSFHENPLLLIKHHTFCSPFKNASWSCKGKKTFITSPSTQSLDVDLIFEITAALLFSYHIGWRDLLFHLSVPRLLAASSYLQLRMELSISFSMPPWGNSVGVAALTNSFYFISDHPKHTFQTASISHAKVLVEKSETYLDL